jgi:hypothetical protein
MMRRSGASEADALRVAVRDPALVARVISRVPLRYTDGADRSLDRPAHVRAASSLASIGDRIAVIQDDANFIAVFRPADGDVQSITLPAGADGVRQFDDLRGNKHRKLDLEASVAAIENGRTTLLAFGSGSSPEREHVAIVTGWESGPMAVEMVEAPALYAALRLAAGFAGSELNLEGAALKGHELWLFGRGNGAHRGELRPVNATCVLDWPALRRYLRSPHEAPAPRPERTVRYELGALGNTDLGFTDAIAITNGFLYSAAAEASPDAVTDGPVAGSCVGVIGDDGTVRWAPLTDATGALFTGKVEGIASSRGAPDHLTAVVDHDDPVVPSELCTVALQGPWFHR